MDSSFSFELKRAPIYLAVRWEKSPVFKFVKPAKKLGMCLFIASLFLFLYGFLFENLSQAANQRLFWLALVFLILTIASKIIESFFNLKLKQPRIKINIKDAISKPQDHNLAEFLSFEAAKACSRARKICKSNKLSEINSSALFYYLIGDNPKLNFIFSRILLNINDVRELLKSRLDSLKSGKFEDVYSADFQNVILESLKVAAKKKPFKG